MDSSILKKLGFKGQSPALIMNAPDEFLEIIKENNLNADFRIISDYTYIQAFYKTMENLMEEAKLIVEAVEGDALVWICYPKGTSKNYKSDIKRDKIVEVFSKYDFRGVSMVSLDDDWSAIRVRHKNFIKSLNE